MGYAMPGQETAGIHFRQWSRAYIFAEASNITNRIVFVNIDACMGTQAMKIEVSIIPSYWTHLLNVSSTCIQVVRKLRDRYGNLYSDDNVCISAIHTHSGPAGYFQYVLYEVTSKGFVNATLNAIVDGMYCN